MPRTNAEGCSPQLLGMWPRARRSWVLRCANATALLAGTAFAGHATAFDVVADFSPTQNPNGVWRYVDAGNIQFPLLVLPYDHPFSVTATGVKFDAWNLLVPPDRSELHKNSLGSEFDYLGVNHRTDELVLYPKGGFAAVEFTPPTAGPYVTSFSFRVANKQTPSPVYLRALLQRGTQVSPLFSLDITGLTPQPYGARFETLGLSINLLAGDHLYWIAGSAVGPTARDQIGLQVVITAVPEPASWALYGGGLCALLLILSVRRLTAGT